MDVGPLKDWLDPQECARKSSNPVNKSLQTLQFAWVSYCIKHWKEPSGFMHLWLATELCMISNMQNEPWPPSLAALRNPSHSLSNKVLTWGQQSFELSPHKRLPGWCKLWSWLDEDNEARALLQDSPPRPALTPRHRRQIKGIAGGTALESHLSP